MVCVSIPIRYIIGGVLCLTSMIYLIVQSNVSIIILAMTNPIHNDTDEPPPDYGPRYDWSAYDQSIVLGSFFWGSMVSSPFAGVFAERYGPRYICGLSIVSTTIFTALAPISANILWLTIVLRFLSGVVMGTILPSLQALIANWVPPEEKGIFLSSLLFNGIGTIIDWSMSGFIIEYFGWHYAFYAVVIILVIFSMLWFSIIYDSPSKHPKITEREKDYIVGKLQKTTTKIKWPPFRSILLSMPFWALAILKFGASWGISFILTAAPRYLSEVHKFSLSVTGLLGSIPYLMRCIGGISFGLIGDFLLKRKIMSVTAIRKYFCLCSHIIPGCLLIFLTFFDDPYICVAFISIAMGISGATTITTLANAHDIAPNFAATVYSISGVGALTPGFLAPLVVAYYTQERSSRDEWQYIFYIGGGIYIATAVLFIIFGSGSIQKWDHVREDVEEPTDKSYVSHENLSKIKD